MTTEETAPGGQESGQQTPPEGAQEQSTEPKTYDEAYVSKLRDENARYRTQRNEYKSQVEKVRQEKMTPDEKVLAEAEQRGRAAAAKDYGTQLARAQFNALAGRRNPDFETDAILDDLNLGKYVDDEGKVQEDDLKKAVARLVPEPSTAPPSFDRGSRAPAPAGTNMSDLIRRSAGITQ